MSEGSSAATAASEKPDSVQKSPTSLQIVGLNKKTNGFELIEDNLASVLTNPKIQNLPAVVISVAGPFRLGKSFLLNYFLKYLSAEEDDDDWLDTLDQPDGESGFSWAHGSTRDTTGIWMYRDPIIRRRKDGSEVAVILVDTQGTFDNKTSSEMNAIVFALNSLISSVQIYNVSKRVGEDVLQHMHMFTKFGQMAYEQQSAENDSEHVKPFQRLKFLVRDWGGKADFPFGDKGGTDYLETVLNSSDGDGGDKLAELQEVRRDIRECFDDLSCFLMPHPGVEVAEGDKGDISERFATHLREFVPGVLGSDKLVVKQMLGDEITCGTLRKYIATFVELFQKGELPTVHSVFEATAKLNHEGIKHKCLDSYSTAMKAFAGAKSPYREHESLQQMHEESLAEALVSETGLFQTAYHECPQITPQRTNDFARGEGVLALCARHCFIFVGGLGLDGRVTHVTLPCVFL
eukprot:m.1302438 g.1302438  ORF g.1302438 m.1302438 type:complete len:462 (-) comp24807_c1_seq31:3200-4585(-)